MQFFSAFEKGVGSNGAKKHRYANETLFIQFHMKVIIEEDDYKLYTSRATMSPKGTNNDFHLK